jgi:hypothetical protein
VQKACPRLIIIIVIILLQRQRMGLFSGRESVDSQLSSDECSTVEEKQSWGPSDGLYSVIVEMLSRVDRGDAAVKFPLLHIVKEIEVLGL